MAHMPTVAMIEVEQSARHVAHKWARREGTTPGGPLVTSHTAVTNGRDLIAVEFPSALLAARMTWELFREIAGPDPHPRLRAIISDCKPTTLQEAQRLLRKADDGQILVDASIAVLVASGLGTPLQLVLRNSRGPCNEDLREMVYELREDKGSEALVTSTMGWAHRAIPAPLVGREAVSAQLEEAWRTSLDGNSRALAIWGETGVGKTAIAANLALRARAEGALVLYGRQDPPPSSSVNAVREAFSAWGTDSGFDWTLERPGDNELSGVDQLALYEHLEMKLERLGAGRAVLVVLEDLQWAEPACLHVANHLHLTTRDAPLMVLASMRHQPGDFGGGANLGAIELRGLEAGAVAQLVEHRFHAASQADHEVVGQVAAVTGGNPLFLRHLLDGVRSVNALERVLTAQQSLPQLLVDVVYWRVRSLPIHTQHLLAQAASIDLTFDCDSIAKLSSLPPTVVRSALDDAVQDGLLRLEKPGHRWSFTHEVVRRTLAEAPQTGSRQLSKGLGHSKRDCPAGQRAFRLRSDTSGPQSATED